MTSKFAVQYRPFKGPHSLDRVACWAPAHYIRVRLGTLIQRGPFPPPGSRRRSSGPHSRRIHYNNRGYPVAFTPTPTPTPTRPSTSGTRERVAGGAPPRPPPLQCPPRQPRPPRSAAGEVACLVCQHRWPQSPRNAAGGRFRRLSFR
jgi:hypothetical protein